MAHLIKCLPAEPL